MSHEFEVNQPNGLIYILQKLARASMNSRKGLIVAWRNEWAFRFEVILLIVAIPCAFTIGSNPAEYALMISSVVLLPMIELLNTAIETVVNRIGFEYHELSGLAKDLASAALAVACLNAAVIWGIILFAWLLQR